MQKYNYGSEKADLRERLKTDMALWLAQGNEVNELPETLDPDPTIKFKQIRSSYSFKNGVPQ